MPKLLIIDKSYFHKTSLNVTSLSKLIKFARNYHIVLPTSLFIECLISEDTNGSRQDKDPQLLLKCFDDVIKAGGKFGYSFYELFQAEKMTLCYVKSVVDEVSTQQFRYGTLNIDTNFVKKEAEYCRKLDEPKIKLLLELAEKFYKNLIEKGLSEDFRKETNKADRFSKWTLTTDQKMKDIMRHLFSEQISSRSDSNWITWQRTRLWFVYSLEWACKRNQSGPSYTNYNISNDFYDIEYVAYLSRADGILTRDERLVQPLAKAAFPERDVFSSLEDVPEEYLGDWT